MLKFLLDVNIIFHYLSIQGCKHMFSAVFKEVCCKFVKNIFFENSKLVIKMVNMLWKGCCDRMQFFKIKTCLLMWKVKKRMFSF